MGPVSQALSMGEFGRDRGVTGEERQGSGEAAAEERAAPFEVVFAEYAPAVWRMVRSLGVHESDLEDVCQEVFIVVHRRLPGFEGRSALRTWIYGIALRVVADYRKKAHRKRERLYAEPPELADHGSPERHAAATQAFARLDRILAQLSEERRQVFVLYEIEQLPMSEIAEMVGCPLKTAYSRLEAAREIVLRKGRAVERS